MANNLISKVVKRLAACASVGALVLGATWGMASAGELIVYSAVDPEEVPLYKGAFEKAYPNIKLSIVRGSTGTTTARILAEKDNPKHDVTFRIANTSLIVMGKEGLLYAYEPKGLDKIDPSFRDKANKPPIWAGSNGYMAAICYNVPEAKKYNLPRPTSWQDLIKPIYKGHLTAPNPKASGTGFINLTTFVYLWGEEKAFEYMDKLHENIKFYMNSGSAPCRKAAAGEVPIAMSWGYRAVKLIAKGAPIEFLTLKEGMGWDLEGSGIMKAAEKRGHLEDAKTFMDWTISEEAMKVHNKNFAIIAMPEKATPVKNHPSSKGDVMKLLVDYDFVWNAENRNRLIAKWLSRYEGKVQKKKK